MHPDLVSLLAHCRTLPTLPGVALRLLELAEDPGADLAATAEAIALDPALSARLLRIANSPLYASTTRRRVDTLSQALALLGLNAALSLALGFAVARTMQADRALAGLHERVWHRSVLAATAARVLCERLQFERPEELMLGALLQDIGILALLSAMPERYAQLPDVPLQGRERLEAERDHLGGDHTEVGAWLAARWGLSAYLQRMIRSSETVETRDPTLGCVVAAGLFADVWLRPDDAHARDQLDAIAGQCLGLAPLAVEELAERLSALAPEVATLFDVRIEREEQARQIEHQGRELSMIRQLLERQELAAARSEADRLEARARELDDLVRRDPLTGAYNRRQLEDVLQQAFDEADRLGRPLSIAFIDLDDFKRVNDRHGHLVGDKVLREFSQSLSRMLRASDLLARYGGEEFLVVLHQCDAEHGRQILERILATIAAQPMAIVHGEPIHVTFSAGLATHGEEARFPDARAMLQAADEALYGAKREGRNQIAMPGRGHEGAHAPPPGPAIG
ncbi:HDOD domain-containing protein [Luteimonas sp. Y-2-2-4F]|nr:HDOD domain-containing protein [Luteimonas sp. Y-2-2-4F]MCD9031471.1 HDOD domain-containing protein [Luteimonas sp. Y-2-2-4F]